MDAAVAAIRCRPLTPLEVDGGLQNAVEVVEVEDSKQVIVSGERAFTKFSFNHAYGGGVNEEKFFDDVVKPVVKKVMEGFNACVMAYGQTGSGKTYTMGTKANASVPGVVQRALLEFFNSDVDFDIEVSFLEIYKEEALDLLSTSKTKMHVIDFKPVGLTKLKVPNVESALNVMEKGLANRHVAATDRNTLSSRSHAVLTIYLNKKTDTGLQCSKLHLVDLAGSESVSTMFGDTRKEGVMINKGLLQLGIVMSTLASAGDHIPYRPSILTSILKDALNLKSFVVLIGCISPLYDDAAMTINSLNFANRLKSMKSNPEAGPVIKQRLTTPFKVPFDYKQKVNNTIATGTPCSLQKNKRPALRPLNYLNNTYDSPRTPRAGNGRKQIFPTSTPFQEIAKPLFSDPTPIPKPCTSQSRKRRSSSEWNTLNISSSTVVDSVTSSLKVNEEVSSLSLLQNADNETWLRSLIADVVRGELRSLTLSQTTLAPSPPKQPRRSARLSSPQNHSAATSFFEHELDTTAVAIPSTNDKEPAFKTSRLPKPPPYVNTTVRRSTRLSVAPRPVYCPESNATKAPSIKPLMPKAPKQTKKAARLSMRFSLLPPASPENAQNQINSLVLDILKNGDLKKLQSLPTIGPKTAVIINNHRLLHGPINDFKDLENIRGLTTNFVKRFLWANNIVSEEEAY